MSDKKTNTKTKKSTDFSFSGSIPLNSGLGGFDSNFGSFALTQNSPEPNNTEVIVHDEFAEAALDDELLSLSGVGKNQECESAEEFKFERNNISPPAAKAKPLSDKETKQEKEQIKIKSVRFEAGGYAHIAEKNDLNLLEEDDYLDLVKSEAKFIFSFSRSALYQSLGMVQCWKHKAKQNETYLSSVFANCPSKGIEFLNTNTVKVGLELGDKKFKSKVHQYSKALDYFDRHNYMADDHKPTDDDVLYFANLIEQKGGIKGVIEALADEIAIENKVSGNTNANKDSDSTQAASNNKAKWESSTSFINEFDYANDELDDGKLVVMVGKYDSKKVKVLKVMSDEKLLTSFARKAK